MLNDKYYINYFEQTKNQVHSPWLADAVDVVKNKESALDFGCGAGRDTKYLLEKGFKVTAVDGSPLAEKYIKLLPHQERLNFIPSLFEDFVFPVATYDLVNSHFALPYTSREKFKEVFSNLEKSLKPGGIFVGQLFGVRDDWQKSEALKITFHTADQARQLFVNWELMAFAEKEYDGNLANGTPKHWHVFHIIARKK